MMVAAAISGATKSSSQQNHPSRPPLLPSEKNNGVAAKKPRGRQVSSRYLSPSPSSSSTSTTTTTTTTCSSSSSSSASRRFPSPLLSRSTNSASSASATPFPSKRSQSVDRRRPVTAAATPRPTTPLQGNGGGGGEVSAAARLLVTSTRSLSVSFQGEAFSLPISKTKTPPAPPATPSGARKATPERRRTTPLRGGGGVERDQSENSRPGDHHRWPARARSQTSTSIQMLSRSVDFGAGGDNRKLTGFGSGTVVRALQQSLIDDTRRASFDGRLSLDLGNAELPKPTPANNNDSLAPSDLTASDTDSVSSGSTSGVQDVNGVSKARSGSTPKGNVVSARFWQGAEVRRRSPSSSLSLSLSLLVRWPDPVAGSGSGGRIW